MGHTEPLPNGRYKGSYRGRDGKERTKTFDLKLHADGWWAAAEVAKARGEWYDPSLGRITLGDFIEQDYGPTTTDLAESTLARDASYVRNYLLPTFGRMPIAAIDYPMCQAWANGLAARLAPATTVKAAQILGKIFKVAIRSKRLVHNPMEGVKLPTIEDPDDVYLTPAQIQDLADAMDQIAPRFRALVLLGCYAGPRPGELLDLRWSDFDSATGALSITKGVVDVSGHLIQRPTKTKAGRRVVTVPPPIVAELEMHREMFGVSERIFTSAQSCPVRLNQFRQREWAKAVKSAGLDPRPTPHDMRHTAVSLWVAAGGTDLEVCRWAGHRSVSFTKDRYAHLFPEHGEALAARLGDFFVSATPVPAAPRRGPESD